MVEIVAGLVAESAFDHSLYCSLELGNDVGLGLEIGLGWERGMGRDLVRVIGHAEPRVARMSASLVTKVGNLPRSMRSPAVERSWTWFGDPRRFGGLHIPLHSAVLGYLENW